MCFISYNLFLTWRIFFSESAALLVNLARSVDSVTFSRFSEAHETTGLCEQNKTREIYFSFLYCTQYTPKS